MIYYYDSYPGKLRWNEKYNRNTSPRCDPLGNNRDGIVLTHINASNLCESIDRARSLKPCSLYNRGIAVGHSVQTVKRRHCDRIDQWLRKDGEHSR